MSAPKRLLVIYTGGTIGMETDPATGALRPVNLVRLNERLPEIDQMGAELTFYSFEQPIDSSNMTPAVWLRLAQLIVQHYEAFDGFILLHGTDTMAYTASALSFLLEGLNKPVLLTGAQLPLDRIRTDARENLITSIEIATAPQVLPEVAICFDTRLLRGNRTIKYSSLKFHAFISPNYPPLGDAGVTLELYTTNWLARPEGPLQVQRALDVNVAQISFYPGIPEGVIETVLAAPQLRAVVLKTFGTGNVPDSPSLYRLLERRIGEGLVVVNVSQCPAGMVEQGRYAASHRLVELGVVSGRDITPEAALTKLMVLLGRHSSDAEVARRFAQNLAGELTLGDVKQVGDSF